MDSSQVIKVSYPATHVAEISVNRPEKLNSITYVMFKQIDEWFQKFAQDPEVRVIIFSGNEKIFSAGGDIYDLAGGFPYESDDPARKSLYMWKVFGDMTKCFETIENCGKPVIAAVSGICIGSALELTLACDIRYCTKSMKFALKEINNGITAWMGGIQRIHKLIGWHSWVREILFTGRFVTGEEAHHVGLFSRMFDTYKEMMDYTLEMAQTLASKSPVAMYGAKTNFLYSRDNSVKKNLEFVSAWNGFSYHTADLPLAISSQMQKVAAVFPKL
jgi:delta(3,5)-delta(2,4)-dienoyl-CoA isomerase